MKLIDLLARELTTWPIQGMGCNYCVADSEGEVFFGSGTKVKLSEAPEDHETARVTRKQWEALRWNGKGLPPVGTMCEGRHKDGEWRRCEILAVTQLLMILRDPDVEEISVRHAYWEFRPIRTIEQIAEEERNGAIHEMVDNLKRWNTVQELCGHLYDAGYRKVQS